LCFEPLKIIKDSAEVLAFYKIVTKKLV